VLDDKQRSGLPKGSLEQYPDYFLDEFCACFERDREKKVSKTTMWRAIVSLGFTQHKLDIIAKQASDVKRAEYLLHIVHFDIPQLVFVDEVHTDHRTYERHFGWAMAGRRAVKRGIYLRGEKYSSAAAISTSGVLTHYSLRGGFKALDFQFFMETFVIPVLGVYPAAKSVVVMDNASIHKKNILSNLAAIHGFLCVFLPPYSPVLNPIETMFSKFKYFLRRYAQSLESIGMPHFQILRLAFQSITESDCRGYFRCCGYSAWVN